MPNSSLQDDLQNFVEFARRRMSSGNAVDSVEDLVQQWRQDSEFGQAVADVRQGLADDAAGRAEPTSQAFADIRRRLGINT